MRIVALLVCGVAVAGCSKKEEAPPAADTTAMTVAPAEPAPITLESVAGTWNFNVRGMDGDSVLTTNVLTATADPAGWSFVQKNGEKVKVRDVVAAGDSITAVAGPFSSGVRKGMRVTENRSVYRLQDGKLVGVSTAHYAKAGADSVRQFRLEGTKQ